jgi:hypothetical protein
VVLLNHVVAPAAEPVAGETPKPALRFKKTARSILGVRCLVAALELAPALKRLAVLTQEPAAPR